MNTVVAVALGGMLGCLLRFAISDWSVSRFPAHSYLATLVVNLFGCLLIGWCYGFFMSRPEVVSAALRAGLMAGFLGGLTTFSTFSVDTMRLIENGAVLSATFYLAVSLFGGLFACWLGLTLAKF